MDMPDMPVNVPVDDPNADTEWLVLVTRIFHFDLRTHQTPGMIFFANTESFQKSLRLRHL